MKKVFASASEALDGLLHDNMIIAVLGPMPETEIK